LEKLLAGQQFSETWLLILMPSMPKNNLGNPGI